MRNLIYTLLISLALSFPAYSLPPAGSMCPSPFNALGTSDAKLIGPVDLRSMRDGTNCLLTPNKYGVVKRVTVNDKTCAYCTQKTFKPNPRWNYNNAMCLKKGYDDGKYLYSSNLTKGLEGEACEANGKKGDLKLSDDKPADVYCCTKKEVTPPPPPPPTTEKPEGNEASVGIAISRLNNIDCYNKPINTMFEHGEWCAITVEIGQNRQGNADKYYSGSFYLANSLQAYRLPVCNNMITTWTPVINYCSELHRDKIEKVAEYIKSLKKQKMKNSDIYLNTIKFLAKSGFVPAENVANSYSCTSTPQDSFEKPLKPKGPYCIPYTGPKNPSNSPSITYFVPPQLLKWFNMLDQ